MSGPDIPSGPGEPDGPEYDDGPEPGKRPRIPMPRASVEDSGLPLPAPADLGDTAPPPYGPCWSTPC